MATLSQKSSPSVQVKASKLSKRAQIIIEIALALFSPLLMLGLLRGSAYLWENKQAEGLYAWELVASRRIELIKFPNSAGGYTLMKPDSHYDMKTSSTVVSSGSRNPTQFMIPLIVIILP